MPGASAATPTGDFNTRFAQDTMLSRDIAPPVSSAASTGGFNPLQLLMAISGLGTFATSYMQSKAQSAEGEYNASVFESNARLEALKAEDAIIRGEKEVVKLQQARNRLIGSQRVSFGAQGIDLESGSALDIQQETRSLGAEDILNTRNNAWREAWGYRVNENNYRGKAKYSLLTAKNTAKNTILTGGLSIAKSFAYSNYLNKNRSASSYDDYRALVEGGF